MGWLCSWVSRAGICSSLWQAAWTLGHIRGWYVLWTMCPEDFVLYRFNKLMCFSKFFFLRNVGFDFESAVSLQNVICTRG